MDPLGKATGTVRENGNFPDRMNWVGTGLKGAFVFWEKETGAWEKEELVPELRRLKQFKWL